MRIHSLSIDNFRGIEHLALEELPDTGVIVIHGDNEQGKSTILDALHAALYEKHGGRSGRVRAWKPVGRDVSPSVSATATIGPVTFTITKNWLKAPKAELHITAPHRESFTGGDAEEKLAEIISRHLDRDLAETLFMRQGDLDAGIAAVGITSVTRALDGVSEDGDSGTEDTALSAAVEKEYERYFTPKGTPARELKEARAAHTTATEEHAAASTAHAELTGYVDRHDRATARRARALADLPAAEAEERTLDEKARADWEKTMNEVIKEKVAGEMAQGLVKRMLNVAEDATKEQIAGEIDKLLADETIKTAISRFHTDFPPVVGGYSGSGSGVVKKRTSSI